MQIEHKKNTDYYLAFPMVDSTNPENFKTGETVTDTAYYKDGAGAWTSLAIADTVTEISTTGIYEIDLAAAEMNHDQVMVKMASTNGADTAFLFDTRTKIASDLNDPTAAAIADSVWDEAFSGHTSAGTYGKIVKNLGEGVVSIDGAVNDVGATVNTFITNLAEASDSHYSDLTLIFTSGNLKGQAKPIASYNGTTKTIVLSEDLSEAPADTDEFLILAIHVHPVTQIAEGVRTEIDSNSTQLAAIVGDTNELQTDLTDGGRLDLIIDELTAQGDTNESKIDTIDTNVDAVLVDTSTTIPAQITALNDVSVNDILTTQFTESYSADGSAPTLTQALMLIQQMLGDFSITGTTLTVKQLDGATTAGTFTLNDGTSPTSVTRAT